MSSGGQLISVRPEEITFEVELEKQAHSCIKITNNTDEFVAFKVKTTSPTKYNVRPNASVLQPRDRATMIVTLHAQKELPPDLQCNDKFLIQSTIMNNFDFDEIPPDTFIKDDKKVIEECKLRVVYVPPRSDKIKIEPESSEDNYAPQMLKSPGAEEGQGLQHLREELVSTLHQNKLLQQELEMLSRSSSRRTDAGFSLILVAVAAFFGILIGIILNSVLSSHA